MQNKKRLLKEDNRITPQSYPASYGSPEYNHSGAPTIDIMTPYKGQPDIDMKKAFRDELPAAEGGRLLPYTLDRLPDAMVKVVEGCEDAKIQLKETLSHPSMNEGQKEYIKKQMNILGNMSKMAMKLASNIDSLSIGGN